MWRGTWINRTRGNLDGKRTRKHRWEKPLCCARIVKALEDSFLFNFPLKEKSMLKENNVQEAIKREDSIREKRAELESDKLEEIVIQTGDTTSEDKLTTESNQVQEIIIQAWDDSTLKS